MLFIVYQWFIINSWARDIRYKLSFKIPGFQIVQKKNKTQKLYGKQETSFSEVFRWKTLAPIFSHIIKQILMTCNGFLYTFKASDVWSWVGCMTLSPSEMAIHINNFVVGKVIQHFHPKALRFKVTDKTHCDFRQNPRGQFWSKKIPDLAQTHMTTMFFDHINELWISKKVFLGCLFLFEDGTTTEFSMLDIGHNVSFLDCKKRKFELILHYLQLPTLNGICLYWWY